MPLWKDLDLIVKKNSVKVTCNILKIGFALSKRPHFNRAYSVIGRYSCSETVSEDMYSNFGNYLLIETYPNSLLVFPCIFQGRYNVLKSEGVMQKLSGGGGKAPKITWKK